MGFNPMFTLSIAEHLITLFIIPIIIALTYYLYKIGFFHDEVELKKIKFITLSADEGKRSNKNE